MIVRLLLLWCAASMISAPALGALLANLQHPAPARPCSAPARALSRSRSTGLRARATCASASPIGVDGGPSTNGHSSLPIRRKFAVARS